MIVELMIRDEPVHRNREVSVRLAFLDLCYEFKDRLDNALEIENTNRTAFHVFVWKNMSHKGLMKLTELASKHLTYYTITVESED